MARSGYRLAKRIADLVNIETKCFFYQQTAANPIPARATSTVNWSGTTPVIVNEIELGDLDFQRIGDSVKLQHLDFYLHQRAGALTVGTVSAPTFRVIVFWDETNGTTTEPILEAGYYGTNIITCMTKDWDEKASTKILYDYVWTPSHLGFDSANIMYINQHTHRHSMPINKHTQFENGGQVIVTGAIKVLFFSNIGQNQTIDWAVRMLFTDD